MIETSKAKIDKVERIIETVAKEFKAEPKDILKIERGSRETSTARNVIAVFLKDLITTNQIVSLLGRRGYQYVRNSEALMIKKMDDHEFYMRVMKLSDRLGVKLTFLP